MKRTKRRFRIRVALVLASLAVVAGLLSGCQTLGYYKQAVTGQYQIFARQQALKRFIADPKTTPELKSKFELVLRLREFAERELKLATDGHYQSYADLERRFVVWNVNMAPEFSLEPKTWWYPFVGRLKYRGFFSEAQARRYAGKLAEQGGVDVYVGGVEAYSTLGWFKDPVLNTFIHHSEADLAEILFHELAHHRVFARGDTDFNEAFATAVAAEGVRRWLAAAGDREAYERYLAALRRERQFVELVLATREELKAVYGETDAEEQAAVQRFSLTPALSPSAGARENPTSPAGVAGEGPGESTGGAGVLGQAGGGSLRERKAAVLERMQRRYRDLKAEWGGRSEYDRWFAQPVNNAQLNTVATYYHLVPAFQQLLRDNGGELERFYQAVRRLAKLPKKERHRQLEAILQKSDGGS